MSSQILDYTALAFVRHVEQGLGAKHVDAAWLAFCALAYILSVVAATSPLSPFNAVGKLRVVLVQAIYTC